MSNLNGIVVVNKPPMVTSHDVVDAFRRISGIKKVGHCGTLDPGATGVLVLVVGKATRLSSYLLVDPKEYTGEVVLGVETDTYDSLGKVLSEKECNATEEQIREAFGKFTGTFLQEPPPISAKKVGGVPLYKLSRKGVKVKVEPKEVTVYELEIRDIRQEGKRKVVDIRIVCSSGTYVRGIAHDVGKLLGCGGMLNTLHRTKSGLFDISQAFTLEELEELARRQELEKAVIPPAQALKNYRSVTIRQGYVARVANGEPVQLRMVKGLKFDFTRFEIVRLLDERGRFIGLARWVGDLARSPQDLVAKPFLIMVS